MYRQLSGQKNRYFPSKQSTLTISNNNKYRTNQIYSKNYTPNKQIQSRIIYGTRNIPSQNRYEAHPQFITTSSRLTQMNQKIIDDTNLLRRRSSSKRKKIFDARETQSLYRKSGYSVQSNNNQSRNSRDNMMHYYNPVSSKIPQRSRSKQRYRNGHQVRNETYRNENNLNAKVPILFSYNSPQTLKNEKVKKPQVYQSTLTDIMRKPVIYNSMNIRQQQNYTLSSNGYENFSPKKQNIKSALHLMKEPAYEASKLKFQKIEGKKYEEGFSDDEEDDRFFDMDFRTEGRKEEFSEMKSGLLSPLKQKLENSKEMRSNFGNLLKQTVSKVLKDGENDGKVITIVVIVLGLILVLFQAIK